MEGIYNNLSKASRDRLKTVTEQMSLDNQLVEVGQKLENLALTPTKFSNELLNQSGKRFEEGTREFIKVSREGRNAWSLINDEFMKLGREYHRTILRSLEDTARSVTTVGRS